MKQEIQERLGRIEELVQQIETAADPNIRAVAIELMQTLLEIQGASLERMLEIVSGHEATGQLLIDQMGGDELVGPLLVLHGMHPLPLGNRVMNALQKVRPYLNSHGGNVELLGINDEGVVRLRLEGSCKTCPSSSVTMKLAVEEAIYQAAPDVIAIETEGLTQPQTTDNMVHISRTPRNGNGAAKSVGWEKVSGINSLGQSTVKTMEVGGRAVLFCRLGENLYAYGNDCPQCGRSLQEASLEASNLICLGCGQNYDVVQAGRGLDKPDLHLEPFPLLVEHGQVKVALPAQVAAGVVS